MLKLNPFVYFLYNTLDYLNTSHVKVKHKMVLKSIALIADLNTSHVKVKLDLLTH